MSSDATVLMPPPAAEAAAAIAMRRLALRIGVGATLGFVLGELFNTPLFFLPPLLAVTFLASMPQPPTLRQGLGVVVLIALLSGLTLMLSSVFAGQPVVFLLLVGLLLFFGFLLDTAGKTMPATSLLTLSAMIPLAAVQSLATAVTLAEALVGAHAIGLLTTWIAFAAFPAPSAVPIVPTKIAEASPNRALVNTLLLFPVLLLFMIGGAMTFVVLMVIIAILRLGERSTAHRAALGLLLGNILGGIVATIAYGFVTLNTSVVFFLLVVLLVGLIFGARIAAGGPQTPLFLLALVTFIILFGIGVSPLPTDSGAAFAARLWNVLLAGAYAVGAVSLIGAQRPAAESAGPESPGVTEALKMKS
jgi:hypothetical protein